MGLILQDSITEARAALNDSVAPYRYSDEDLLLYANDSLDEMAMLPTGERYFSTVGEMECVAGNTRQQVEFDDAVKLVDIVRIKDGNVPLPADKAALDAFNPAWHTDTAGAAVNWMPDPSSPIRFYIYPKAPDAQTLEVRYVAIPAEFTADQDTGLPNTLRAAVSDYVCYRAETRDDEYATQNRNSAFYQAFVAKLGS